MFDSIKWTLLPSSWFLKLNFFRTAPCSLYLLSNPHVPINAPYTVHSAAVLSPR